MDKPEQRFAPNTRVRLREGVDPGFYGGFSRVGQEGWIRRRKRDKWGFPEVLIEWDKDHWAYNRQPDGWTMEGHFEPVEEQMSEKEKKIQVRDDQVRELTAGFVEGLFKLLGAEVVSDDSASEAETEDPQEKDGQPSWDEIAADAASKVTEGVAYAVIVLNEREAGGKSVILPSIYLKARTKQLGYVVQSQLAHFSAELQDQAIGTMMQAQASDEVE